MPKCPITKQDFFDGAEPLKVVINGVEHIAAPKEFSTGSFGWYLNAKATVMIGGKAVPVQVGGNFTVVGSKEAAREQQA